MIQLARILLLAALMYGGASSGLVIAWWARASSPITMSEGIWQSVATVAIGTAIGLLLFVIVEPALKSPSEHD